MLVLSQEKTSIAPPEGKTAFKGLVQVYTGNGKGKSTAALGVALRASGHDMRSIVIGFMNGHSPIKQSISEYLPVDIIQLDNSDISAEAAGQYKCHEQALTLVTNILTSGDYDVVILDEIFSAVNQGVTIPQILELISRKPETVELVLTGPDAPEAVIQLADLATEMVAVKFP